MDPGRKKLLLALALAGTLCWIAYVVVIGWPRNYVPPANASTKELAVEHLRAEQRCPLSTPSVVRVVSPGQEKQGGAR